MCRSEKQLDIPIAQRFSLEARSFDPNGLTNMFTRVLSFSFCCVDTLITPYFLMMALVTCVFETISRFCSTCSVAKFIEALIFCAPRMFRWCSVFETLCIIFIGCIVGVVSSRSITSEGYEELFDACGGRVSI